MLCNADILEKQKPNPVMEPILTEDVTAERGDPPMEVGQADLWSGSNRTEVIPFNLYMQQLGQ